LIHLAGVSKFFKFLLGFAPGVILRGAYSFSEFWKSFLSIFSVFTKACTTGAILLALVMDPGLIGGLSGHISLQYVLP
jgi:hypothetical protein